MINVDTRILDKVDEDEFWLLMHVAKRINKDKKCFPKNYTLQKDTGWGENKVQKIKSQLKNKGWIKVERRVIDGKQRANFYKVTTPLLKIFIGLNEFESKEEGSSEGAPVEGTPSEGGLNEGTPSEGDISINNNEVLERLSIKQIELFLKNKKNQNSTKGAKTPQTTPKDQLPEEKEKSCDKKEKEEEVVDEDEGWGALDKVEELELKIINAIKSEPEKLAGMIEKAKFKGLVMDEVKKWCAYYSRREPYKTKTKPISLFAYTFTNWLMNARNKGRGKPNSPQLGAAKSSTYYANLDKSKIGF